MALDSVGIGISGLLAFQKALSTASHNITNSDTEGYSRQKVNLTVNDAMTTPSGYLGTGTSVNTITRIVDQFSQDNLKSVTSSSSKYIEFERMSMKLDNIFSNEKSGLSPKIQDLFTSLQSVAESPSSSSAKRQFMSAADSMAKRFNSMSDLLEDLKSETQGKIKTIVNEINSYTSSISDLNNKIVNSSVSGGRSPNDLLDQRDNLLLKLSEKVGVKTINHENGSIGVFIGNGQSLVTERGSSRLSLTPNEFDNSKMEVSISTSTTTSKSMEISKMITSGELGAVLDFRGSSLKDANGSIGRLAAWISDSINKKHMISVDENGNFGANIFQIPKTTPQASSDNTGNAVLSANFQRNIEDTLKESAYYLEKTATAWKITDMQDGSSVIIPEVYPLTHNGIEINMESGVANLGDKFIIDPSQASASSIKSILQSPKQVATAYPITVSSQKAYDITLSSGELDFGIINASLPTVPPELQQDYLVVLNKTSGVFEISEAANASVIVATSPYDDTATEQKVQLGSWSFYVSGDIPDGAILEVNTNKGTQPSGDNRGTLDMAQMQFENLFLGGTETMHGVYEDIVAFTGSEAHNSAINSDAQEALLSQALERRSEISGVNLDEEAAQLIRLQQAYQAAAKVIQVADKMFQVLINTL